MSSNNNKHDLRRATPKELGSRRERIWGWEKIAYQLSLSGAGFKAMVVRDGRESPYFGLVKKDPGTGRVFAFSSDIKAYLSKCEPVGA